MARPVPIFDHVAVETWRESDHHECMGMCVADCDGDGADEIVLAGLAIERSTTASLGLESTAELRVIDFQRPAALAQSGLLRWRGLGFTTADAVCAADVDGDGAVEIVTVGQTQQATSQSMPLAYLRVNAWDGRAFSLKAESIWLPTTVPGLIAAGLRAVTTADIDGDGQLEIVCGGIAETTAGAIPWIEVFAWDAQPLARPKARKLWLPPVGWHGRVESLACGDVDGDGNVEIVSLGHIRDKENLLASDVEGRGELIVWGVRPGDFGLELYEKAKTTWGKASAFTFPQSVKIGNLDQEKGVEIATGGIEIGATQDWRAADMHIWRMVGQNLIEVNGGGFYFTSKSDHTYRSDCRDVFIADIDGDGRNELLSIHELGLKGHQILGLVIAWNPGTNWKTATRAQIFKRIATFAFENDDARWRTDTKVAGIWAADMDGDGRTETITGGFYEVDVSKRGVFSAVFR